ncbi:MAG: FG-GAP-like repeat-containing protein [bacterium]|nr:FG-GAP-like repeat-containing protein [bacterium]
MRNVRWIWAGAMAVAFLFSLPAMSLAQPLFEEIGSQWGFTESENCGMLFWYDSDGDGDMDVMRSQRFFEDTYLYRNDGNQFARVEDIGLPVERDIGGFIPMDFDRDGDVDMFFPGYHTMSLALVFENGVFVDRTSELGLSGLTASRDMKWVDFNRDGWMDLLYGDASQGYSLFRNETGTFFSNVTDETQLPDLPDFHRTCEADVDLDGDMDLFVTLLYDEEHFFLNQGNGVFTDESASSGLDGAHAQGGCVWVDFNRDKYPDLLTQGIGHHAIWLNNRDNTFSEMTVHGTETDFEESDYPYAADYAVADFDMDGDYDFYACRPGGCGDGRAANQMFIQTAQNGMDIWFEDVAPALGMDFMEDGGVSVADFDHDGDLDLSVTLQHQRVHLFRNNTNSPNMLEVQVLGPSGEQDRWLTRVEVYPHGSQTALAVSELNTSNVGRNGFKNYFALDENGHYDVRIYFPCGVTMTPEDYPYLSDIVPSQISHLLTVYMSYPTAADEHSASASEFRLDGAYPNPFNAATTISFSLSTAGHATLSIHNVLGQKVADLVSGPTAAGAHRVAWNAGDQASGIYFVRLAAGQNIAAQKIILLK